MPKGQEYPSPQNLSGPKVKSVKINHLESIDAFSKWPKSYNWPKSYKKGKMA